MDGHISSSNSSPSYSDLVDHFRLVQDIFDHTSATLFDDGDDDDDDDDEEEEEEDDVDDDSSDEDYVYERDNLAWPLETQTHPLSKTGN